MPHLEAEKKKGKDKIVGFHIKILDDGSFLLNTEHSDYDKNEEYSYDNAKAMMEDMMEDMPQGKQKEEDDDNESRGRQDRIASIMKEEED